MGGDVNYTLNEDVFKTHTVLKYRRPPVLIMFSISDFLLDDQGPGITVKVKHRTKKSSAVENITAVSKTRCRVFTGWSTAHSMGSDQQVSVMLPISPISIDY